MQLSLRTERVLNWGIGLLVFFELFGGGSLVKELQNELWVFPSLTLSLCLGTIVIAVQRFRSEGRSALSPHQRLVFGDYSRMFFSLFGGYRRLVEVDVSGFWIFTCLVAFLLAWLIVSVTIELFQKRNINQFVAGCLFFAYCLLSWERNGVIVHFGVPIIGHPLEKVSYDTQYPVILQPSGRNPEYRLMADLRVENRSESEEVGEDRYGQLKFRTFDYRDIWIRKIYFPQGGFVAFSEYDDPICAELTNCYVIDERGGEWYVTIITER